MPVAFKSNAFSTSLKILLFEVSRFASLKISFFCPGKAGTNG